MAINDNETENYQEQIEAFEPDARSMRGGGGGGGGGFRRQQMRRKVCPLCRDKVDYIDYKDTRFLQAFVPERAKIMPRRISGMCAMHQRMLAESIKRSRIIAFLPFVTD